MCFFLVWCVCNLFFCLVLVFLGLGGCLVGWN